MNYKVTFTQGDITVAIIVEHVELPDPIFIGEDDEAVIMDTARKNLFRQFQYDFADWGYIITDHASIN